MTLHLLIKRLKPTLLSLTMLSALAFQQSALAATTLTPNTLTVGVEVAYPPFESWDDGKLVGFDIELAKLISDELALQVKYVDTAFSNLILGLNAKHYDVVISALYITDERLKQADAIAYAVTGAYIMAIKNGEVAPKTEYDLCGLNVGFQQGNAWIKLVRNLSDTDCVAKGKPAIKISEYPTAPESIQALISKNTQAAIEMAGATRVFAEKSRGRVIISSPNVLWPQTLGIYINKGNSETFAAIDKAVNSLKQNGKLAALMNKYSPYGIESVKP